jgi:hypothetical protein
MGQNFSEKVLAYESIIASASSGDAFDLRLFLGFEREYTHLYHPQNTLQGRDFDVIPSLSAINKSALCNLLVAYRMIDIAAALESHSELPIRYEKKTNFITNIPAGTLSFFGNSASSHYFAAFRSAAKLAASFICLP